MELKWLKLTGMESNCEDFQREVKLGLEKQLEEAEKSLIWNKYHKQFMELGFDELKEIVDSYSIEERVQAYFGKHTHIRYKVAKMYLKSQKNKQK